MQIKYCWRCRMDVPMLNKQQGEIASKLLAEGFQEAKETTESSFFGKFQKTA